MKNAILCVLGEIWLFAASIHFILPSGWPNQWYGLPLTLTMGAIIMGTGNYFIDRALKPKKD